MPDAAVRRHLRAGAIVEDSPRTRSPFERGDARVAVFEVVDERFGTLGDHGIRAIGERGIDDRRGLRIRETNGLGARTSVDDG
jgi:hypothetical protein